MFPGDRQHRNGGATSSMPKSTALQDSRPIRAETRTKLIASIACGRSELVGREESFEAPG
jgi:hypothetical protein